MNSLKISCGMTEQWKFLAAYMQEDCNAISIRQASGECLCEGVSVLLAITKWLGLSVRNTTEIQCKQIWVMQYTAFCWQLV